MGDNFQDDFAHGAYLLWDFGRRLNTSDSQFSPASTPGVLKFDIIQNEETEREVETTDHPVEQGVDVTDHARRKLKLIKLEAFVSQEPLDPTLYGQSGNGQVANVTLALPPYPANAGSVTPFGATATALGSLFAGAPPQSFQALQFTNQFDSLKIVLEMLDQLIQDSTLIDVATKSFYYTNHLITGVATKRDKDTGTGTIITLTLKEVRFVSTQQVSAPPLPAKVKDKPSVPKGQQQPEENDSSVLNNLLFGGK